MKFMVNWSIDQDHRITVYKRWSSMSPQERANNMPAGGKLLGQHESVVKGALEDRTK
jgi:hypothetical protein